MKRKTKNKGIDPALFVLYVHNGVFVFAQNLLGPLYALFVERSVGGVMAVGISVAAYWASTTVFTFIVMRFGDGAKEKEYLWIAGMAIRSVGYLAFLLVGNLTGLVLVQLFLGIGEALGTPSYQALVSIHLHNGRHIKDLSIWHAISNIAMGAGALAGGYLVSVAGFTPLFLSMFVLSLFSFIGALLKPRELL